MTPDKRCLSRRHGPATIPQTKTGCRSAPFGRSAVSMEKRLAQISDGWSRGLPGVDPAFLARQLYRWQNGDAFSLRNLHREYDGLVSDRPGLCRLDGEEPVEPILEVSDPDRLYRRIHNVFQLRVRNSASDSGWSIHHRPAQHCSQCGGGSSDGVGWRRRGKGFGMSYDLESAKLEFAEDRRPCA